MDVFEIRDCAKTHLENVRSGQGPRFMECVTYRWHEHVGPNRDYDGEYRVPSELEPWLESDAVSWIAKSLPPDVVDEIDRKIDERISDAFSFAEASQFPLAGELTQDVYG